MPDKNSPEKIPLTLHLSADMAARLKVAAERQQQTAADVAIELLDRYLPRPSTAMPKKGSIPYS